MTARQVLQSAKIVLPWLLNVVRRKPKGKRKKAWRNRPETRDLVVFICACRTMNIRFIEIAETVNLDVSTCINHYHRSKFILLPDHREQVQKVIDQVGIDHFNFYANEA